MEIDYLINGIRFNCATLFDGMIFKSDGCILPCCNFYNYSINTVGKLNRLSECINDPILVKIREYFLNENDYPNIVKNNLMIKNILNDCVYCIVRIKDYQRYIIDRYNLKLTKFLNPEDITNITVDFSSCCQIKCWGCWRNDQKHKPKDNLNHLRPELLKAILTQFPNIKFINISLNGESLLNPNFCELIDIITNHNPNIEIKNIIGFNLNHITDQQIYSILHSNFTDCVISIDGASQETYSRYRVGGDFDKVISNIKRINYYKNLYGNNRLKLVWKMILFDYNLHEVELAEKMARDLGMEFIVSENIIRCKIKEGIYIETKKDKIKELLSNTTYKNNLSFCNTLF